MKRRREWAAAKCEWERYIKAHDINNSLDVVLWFLYEKGARFPNYRKWKQRRISQRQQKILLSEIVRKYKQYSKGGGI